MLWITPTKEMVLLMRKPRRKTYSLICFGRKKHYRKDGTCKHTDAIMSNVKPEYEGKVKVVPFGNSESS